MTGVTHRKRNGVVYTDEPFVRRMISWGRLESAIATKSFLDPACGEGAFLVPIARDIVTALRSGSTPLPDPDIAERLADQVRGNDVNPASVTLCREALDAAVAELGISGVRWSLTSFDATGPEFEAHYRDSVDVVIGNPPYVRIQNIEPATRENLRRFRACQAGAIDLYLAFFEIGLSAARSGGQVLFVTANSFLTSSAGRSLRSILVENGWLDRLIDFGHHKVFKDATTYVAVTSLDTARSSGDRTFDYARWEGEEGPCWTAVASSEMLAELPHLGKASDMEALKDIRSRRQGPKLGKAARIHVGMVTLADPVYIFRNPVFRGGAAEVTGPDGRAYALEAGILRRIIKASTLKSAAEDQGYYVLFPYDRSTGRTLILPEDRLRAEYPLAYAYLRSQKHLLDARDRGKPNPVAWYAFGRTQGLDTAFGPKILTSPMNIAPKFIKVDDPEVCFYSGYCVKSDGDLDALLNELNSEDMRRFIEMTSKDYQNGYKSYAKRFIAEFPLASDVGSAAQAVPNQPLTTGVDPDPEDLDEAA